MKNVFIEKKRYLLNDFFNVEEAYLHFEQFDGNMSPLVRRLNLERGDSVGILIFNRTTGKLILVSQFRYVPTNAGISIFVELIENSTAL